PSWRNGDYEDGTGIWKASDATEANYAKVQLMRPVVMTLRVPEIYGSLRKRFGNALVWYNVLQDATTRHVEDILCVTRSIAVDLHDSKRHNSVDEEFDKPDPFSSPCARAQHPSPATPDNTLPQSSQNIQSLQNIHRAMENEESDSDNPVPVGTKQRHPSARVRPSDYLRSQCPLCFGGEFPQESDGDDPDARDPPRTHPRTVFLPEQGLDAMEKYMDVLRAHKPPPKKTKTTQDDEEDRIEGGLHVPNSVLDGCESGFTATDERRAKASTQFFDDTALMALLCRHDIVLFLANMCSAGEKQHYVISLIEMLFQHLPLECCLGILYDIGCQVKRSCAKWGFLN
ncbi:hypothetical protein DXG01_007601, partial [Tephrocybe rancida]